MDRRDNASDPRPSLSNVVLAIFQMKADFPPASTADGSRSALNLPRPPRRPALPRLEPFGRPDPDRNLILLPLAGSQFGRNLMFSSAIIAEN